MIVGTPNKISLSKRYIKKADTDDKTMKKLFRKSTGYIVKYRRVKRGRTATPGPKTAFSSM